MKQSQFIVNMYEYVRVEPSIDFCRICIRWIDCDTMIPNGISTREIANNVFPTPVSLAYPTSVGRDIMRNVWKTDNYSLTVCDQYKSITYGYFSPDTTQSTYIMKACGQFLRCLRVPSFAHTSTRLMGPLCTQSPTTKLNLRIARSLL